MLPFTSFMWNNYEKKPTVQTQLQTAAFEYTEAAAIQGWCSSYW
jgi:hypothetical protein